MLEKLLVSVKQNPADLRLLESALEMLSQESNAKAKAKGLAELARIYVSLNPLRAVEYLDVGFRLSPSCEEVLNTLLALFELRSEAFARDKVSAFLRKVTQSSMPNTSDNIRTPEHVRAASASATRVQGAPALNQTQFSSVDDENTTAVEVAASANNEAPEPLPPASMQNLTHMGTAVANIAMPSEQLSRATAIQAEEQPFGATPVSQIRETTEPHHPYFLFRELAKNCDLNLRSLEFAAEFSDSLVGLIHFLRYLHDTQQLRGAEFSRAAEYVGKKVAKDAGDFKAQLRFEELLKPLM